MKEYLRMADVFKGQEVILPESWSYDEMRHLSHAINSHDELVAEVERLRNNVKSLKHLAAHFAECGGWDVDAYQEYVNANVE